MGDHKARHEPPDEGAGETREQGQRHPSPIGATDAPEQSQAVNDTALQDRRRPEPAATRPQAGHLHRDTGTQPVTAGRRPEPAATRPQAGHLHRDTGPSRSRQACRAVPLWSRRGSYALHLHHGGGYYASWNGYAGQLSSSQKQDGSSSTVRWHTWVSR